VRQRLRQRGIGYVLGIGANRTVTTGAGAERVTLAVLVYALLVAHESP
jgi:hypothetical protein